jgi:hypothetical protein
VRHHQVLRLISRQARMAYPTGNFRAHEHLPVSVIRSPQRLGSSFGTSFHTASNSVHRFTEHNAAAGTDLAREQLPHAILRRYSSSPRRIPSATAAARSETPSFS